MAEGLRDTLFAKKDAVRRGADTDGEMADSLSSNDSASYNPKETTSSDFMFHYAFLVVWEPSWRVSFVAGSYKLFQPPR